jgi:transposase-like protein
LQRHATRDSWWRDAPQEGRPQYRRGHIVRWRCPACGHTLALSPDWAVPGKRMTRALDDWLHQVQTEGLSARATAARCGLDAKTVRTWLRERGLADG